MRKIIMVFTALLLLHSCTKFGKNITVTGRVLNPITGEGLANIEVQLQKTTSGLPGGFESVKDVYTDADGYFELDHLGSTKSYHLLVQSMENYYRVGWVIDGGYQENVRLSVTKGKKMNVEYHALPYGQIITHTENVNCSGPTDSMQVRGKTDYTPWTSFGYIYRTGCYNNTSSSPSKVPMGYRYYETKVIRSGVTTYVYDTVFVNESGTTYLEILY